MTRRERSSTLTVGAQGRIVIPAELRRELGMVPGEAVVARVEDDRLVIERRAHILRRLRGELAGSVPDGAGMVEALIAERREEARRERGADGR